MTNIQLFRLITTWLGIRDRCLNPDCPAYHDYGGRGIQMCERWQNSVDAFIQDVGARPSGKSLDRRDNNGHYEPGNCRWATREQQARNTRGNKLDESDVRTMLDAYEIGVPIRVLSREFGVSFEHTRRVVRGECFRLEGYNYLALAGYRPRITSKNSSKLTSIHAGEIRVAYANGASAIELGVKYGVHRNNIHRIVSRRSWAS